MWLPMAKAIASGRFGVSVIALVLLAGTAEPPSAAPSGGDEPVLGSMVGSHLGSPQHDPDIDGKVAPPPIGNPLWAISLQSLTSTRDRPLFSPSRRPAAVTIAAPAAAAPPTQAKPAEPVRPPLTLVGTAVGTDLTMGIFVDEATKDVVRLRVGEGHGGWTLRSVDDHDAVLARKADEVTLALPARNGAKPAIASVSGPAHAAERLQTTAAANERSQTPPPPKTATTSDAKPPALPPGKWLDGDGQVIDAPPRAAPSEGGAKARVATWVDGDGQPIGPPPAAPTTEDGKPLGPAIWLDGYGRPIGPAPKVWTDGDGRSITPPPYRWLDQNGKPVIPPAPTWQDGDGQLIGAPLQRHAWQ